MAHIRKEIWSLQIWPGNSIVNWPFPISVCWRPSAKKQCWKCHREENRRWFLQLHFRCKFHIYANLAQQNEGNWCKVFLFLVRLLHEDHEGHESSAIFFGGPGDRFHSSWRLLFIKLTRLDQKSGKRRALKLGIFIFVSLWESRIPTYPNCQFRGKQSNEG